MYLATFTLSTLKVLSYSHGNLEPPSRSGPRPSLRRNNISTTAKTAAHRSAAELPHTHGVAHAATNQGLVFQG